ncbi:uncharacterized protein I206_104658 [Kwoniella pini CBS 10737]|uniref:Protein MPE1 n=1 Tax=Kwoniella pini CBS 10737 TaxID=1296096 RepID=A0A1B9I7F1_9TREE|nr:protein MPE1 [Kwoniella pini CBS 10737]OCF51482.1 protein MPE1 [Kwoniella pini CBS 10737]
MSTVFYRWGAGRNEQRVTFDGTHISVFDLKREIILGNKMGNGKDFDIGVYDNVTGEEFKDDNHQIPRSSSLIARRLPSSAKGRGNAQNYIIGSSAADSLTGDHRIESHARQAMQDKQNRIAGVRGSGGTFSSLSKRFDGKDELKPGEPSVPISTGNAEEDAKIAAVLAQGAENWEQMQEDMSAGYRAPAARAARTNKPSGSAAGAAATSKYGFGTEHDKEPPTGYICYRCGKKGHWIESCPDNEDPAANERKRFVRVTGIPRSFLKTVETPGGVEGSSGGAMLTADGGFVMAMPDQRQWQKQAAVKPRALTGSDLRESKPLDISITCPICKKLIWEATKTPCCKTSFCEECITSHLLENDFECYECESKIQSLDKLSPNVELREKVSKYVEGEVDRSNKEKEESDEADAKEKEENQEADKGEGVKEGKQNEQDKGEEELEEGAISTNDRNPRPNLDNTFSGNRPQQDENTIIGANGQSINLDTLNPQIINTYLMGAKKMLLNPLILPPARTILNQQIQLLQAQLLKMQMMNINNGGIGMDFNLGQIGMNGNGNNHQNNLNGMMGMMDNGIGMNPMMNEAGSMNGMGMGMNMNMNMNIPMNNNMGMGMNIQNNQFSQQQQQQFPPPPQQFQTHHHQHHQQFNRGRGGFGNRGGFRGGRGGGGGGVGGNLPFAPALTGRLPPSGPNFNNNNNNNNTRGSNIGIKRSAEDEFGSGNGDIKQQKVL